MRGRASRWRHRGGPAKCPAILRREVIDGLCQRRDILLLPALRQFRQFSQQAVALRGTGCLCETLHAGFKAFQHLGGETLFMCRILRCRHSPVMLHVQRQQTQRQQRITGMLQGAQQMGQQAKILAFRGQDHQPRR